MIYFHAVFKIILNPKQFTVMTREQINRLEMYQATNTFLDANAAIWSPIPVINTYKTRLVETLNAMEDAADQQESAKVFIGGSLSELKRTISQKMDILDDTLEAYAEDTDNALLVLIISFVLSANARALVR